MISSTAVEPAAVTATPRCGDRVVSERTRARILSAVPDNTRRAYGRQWDLFTAWCAACGRAALPATGETLAERVGHRAHGHGGSLDRA